MAAIVKVDAQEITKDSGLLPILQKKLHTILKNRLRQLPETYHDLYILNRRCCILLNLTPESYPALGTLFQRAVIAIQALPELSPASSAAVSIGKPVSVPQELLFSYATAQFSLDERLIRNGCPQVVEGVNGHDLLKVNDFLSPALRKKLGEYVEMQSWDEIHLLINDVFRQVLQASSCTGRLVLNLANELVHLIDFSAGAHLSVQQRQILLDRAVDRIDACGSAAAVLDEVRSALSAYAGEIDACLEKKDSLPIQTACQFIRRKYNQPITLEDVAGVVGLSPAYFSSVFKRELKQSYVEFLTGVRISAAKSLLTDSTKKVDEIAELVGYQDVKWFSKVFKKTTNLSPLEYRKLYG